MLYYVVGRARRAKSIDQVAVATSDRPADDPVHRFCREAGIPCFRGSEEDVLDRYYQAARNFEADPVVRLTADCPLLDPETIDLVMRTFHAGGYDYVSNNLEPTYPDGLDTELFRQGVLAQAWREASLKSEREHVTPYIWKQPGLFRLGSVRNERDLSGMRWTVDNPEDLEFVRRVYEKLGSRIFAGTREILDVLRKNPELNAINTGLTRRWEGYVQSLAQDAECP